MSCRDTVGRPERRLTSVPLACKAQGEQLGGIPAGKEQERQYCSWCFSNPEQGKLKALIGSWFQNAAQTPDGGSIAMLLKGPKPGCQEGSRVAAAWAPQAESTQQACLACLAPTPAGWQWVTAAHLPCWGLRGGFYSFCWCGHSLQRALIPGCLLSPSLLCSLHPAATSSGSSHQKWFLQGTGIQALPVCVFWELWAAWSSVFEEGV